MIRNDPKKIVCPKCGNIGNIIQFERDAYIIKNDKTLSQRPMYGCNSCNNVFIYDDSLRTHLDDINLKDVFDDIPTGKRKNIMTRTKIKRAKPL
jgi:excinuclease UvrABC ATPase subunit